MPRVPQPLMLSFALLAAFAALAPAAAGSDAYPDGIRPPLDAVLEQANGGELIPVSIVFHDQVSPERIAFLRAGRSRDAARAAVIEELKRTALGSQGAVLARLESLAALGRVERLRPLWIGNVIGVDAAEDLIREIGRRPEVAWINHNPKVDVFLERPPRGSDAFDLGPQPTAQEAADVECGTALMRAPEVWSDYGIDGDGAVIAVIDTGVCYTHPDIANQIWVNPGEDLDGDGAVMDTDDENGVDDDGNGFVDDLIGWNFDLNNNDPNDGDSHGSHVAGTVAGDGTSGTQAGMAPDAKVMVLRVGVTFSDEVDVWNAMQYAADNGADSISMSLGWPHSQNPDRATWRQNCENTIDAGTAMVIAAGNEGGGNEPDNVRTPGDVPRIISVGATTCSDAIAGFSSRGPVSWENVAPWNDHPYPPGLIKPDVSAPGSGTVSHNFCSGYSTKSGTSMATPHVAGAVALMVSANPGLSHDDIKAVLESKSIDLGSAGKDNTYGSGRVDAYEAVTEVFGLAIDDVTVHDDDPNHANGDGGIDTGEIVTLEIALRNQRDDVTSTDVRGFITTTTPGVTLIHDWASWPDVGPSAVVTSDAPHFSVRVDADCNFPIEFLLSLKYDDRNTMHRFSVAVGSPFNRTAMNDDFETDQGWTPGGNASGGLFVREDPNQIKDGPEITQTGDDATGGSGTHCWVTGNGGSNPDDDDVDQGSATIVSPPVDLSDFESADLHYARWYYASPATAPASDFLRVQWSTNGQLWNTLETVTSHQPNWTAVSLPLPAGARVPGVQFRFQVEDSPQSFINSIVEGLIDDVSVDGSRIECEPFTPPAAAAPNAVGNTLLVDLAGDDLRLDWSAPPADGGHDPATKYRIHASNDAGGGFVVDGHSIAPFHVEPEERLDPLSRYYLVESENGGGTSGEAP